MAIFNGTDGNDAFTGGNGSDQIYGLGGDDTLAGGKGSDILAGGAGSDTLDGGEDGDVLWSGDQGEADGSEDRGREKDRLSGGDGNDVLHAGFGDSVDGGLSLGSAGDRLFISFMGAGAGVVADFALSSQTIGGAEIKSIEHVVFCEGSQFDDQIAVTDRITGFFYSGELYGMGGNDTLVAGEMTALLSGGDGDDVLDARASTFHLLIQGDDGDDTIYGGDNSFAVIEGGAGDDAIFAAGDVHGGDGADTIVLNKRHASLDAFGDDGDDIITAVGSTRVTVNGGAGADTITGGNGADVLTSGGSAPNQPERGDTGVELDTLIGGGGDDILFIGYGDSADGGAGKDTLFLSLLGSDHGLRFKIGAILDGGVAPDGAHVTGIETLGFLTATDFADRITLDGKDAAVVSGAGGNDRFVTRAIGAEINGDEGNDVLVSGIGADTFDGGDGFDTVDYGHYAAAVSVDLGPPAGSGPDGDLLTNVENVIGSRFDDTIVAGQYGSALTGGAGDDVLTGNLARDVLIGGKGKDTLTGRGGADQFQFALGDSADAQSRADTIADFSKSDHDQIRLVSKGDPFTFIGTADFTGAAGEVRYYFAGSDTILKIDADGDRTADMSIRLTGQVPLTAEDFVSASSQSPFEQSFGADRHGPMLAAVQPSPFDPAHHLVLA